MQIDKNTVLDFLRQHGHADKVDQADQELPDQVDTDRDSGLLSKFGIDDIGALLANLPDSVRDKLPSDVTDKLGGFLDK